MRLAPLSLLLFLGVVATLFGDEGRDVAYCTDAGLGVFRLRDGSPTKTALAGSTLNEAEATPDAATLIDRKSIARGFEEKRRQTQRLRGLE